MTAIWVSATARANAGSRRLSGNSTSNTGKTSVYIRVFSSSSKDRLPTQPGALGAVG